MTNGATMSSGQGAIDPTLSAVQEMERYCAAHPNSPVAIRHPRLSIRGRTFVALLGPAIEEGITGFGDSVEAALRAFDAQYSRSLKPPADRD
ncbi:MAG TPA: hypothetical protein VGQ70_00675 [Candidatus Udaeobacter sp.]|jgi:hypothetical protein|nr:hypothetical protein [Candidatus Udaeobacter sp.]